MKTSTRTRPSGPALAAGADYLNPTSNTSQATHRSATYLGHRSDTPPMTRQDINANLYRG